MLEDFLDHEGFIDVPQIERQGIFPVLFPNLIQDVHDIRARDFPWLVVNDRAYLDCGATSQEPLSVKKKMLGFYREHGRGSNHSHNSEEARTCDNAVEEVREKVKQFFGASNYGVAFTSGTTDASNKLALNFPLTSDDLVLITEAEHHSQILTLRNRARQVGSKVEFVPVDNEGYLNTDQLYTLATSHKQGKVFLSLVHASNVTGIVNPAREIRDLPDNVFIYLDAAQSAGHMKINLDELGVDFMGISAHKMYGPTGVGALLVREDRQDMFTNYLSGGSAVIAVSKGNTAYAPFPASMEPGTQNLEGIIEFGMVLDYLQEIGMDTIHAHDTELTKYFMGELQKIPQVTVYGPQEAAGKVSVVAFNVGSSQTNYSGVARSLNERGVSVRDGCFCAHPLLAKLTGLGKVEHGAIVERIASGQEQRDLMNLPGAVRASFAFYNTLGDAYKAVKGIREIAREY